jgi:lipopolysaccharide export system permease protein
MSILFRYVARAYLKYLFLCVLAMVMLLLIANIFGNLESIFSSWQKFADFLDSTIRSMPTVLEIVLPMCILLAVVMTFSGLSRNSELVAMKSSGTSTFTLALPILVILLPVSILGYINQNYLFNALHPDGGQRQPQIELHEWRSEGKNIYYFRSINSKKQIVHKVQIFRWLPQPFRVSETVSFARGKRLGDEWKFTRIKVRKQTKDVWKFERRPALKVPADQFPDVFKPFELDAHHMPFFDLYRHIGQLENRSPYFLGYRIEWYQKIAALFAPFIMVLVGIPLSQTYSRRSRNAGEVVVTIFGGMVFWISNEIMLVLGKGGVVTPLLAAWGVNLVFAVLGVALMARSK